MNERKIQELIIRERKIRGIMIGMTASIIISSILIIFF